MPERGPTSHPRVAALEAIDFIRDHADEERAAGVQRYFKEPVQAYGLTTPVIREWTKAFVRERKDEWTVEDAVEFCDAMLEDPHVEPRGTGYLVVAGFVDGAGPELLNDVERWLEESCGNWALVDNLATSVLSPLLRKHPELVSRLKEWTHSPNPWLRRGAPVGLVKLVRQGEQLDAAYDVVSRLLGDEEDLLHKAVGWMLREAGKADRDRLESWLLKMGPRLPRTTLRYAIERFPKEERKRLLEATRES